MAMVGLAPGRFFLCSDDLGNKESVEWDSIAMKPEFQTVIAWCTCRLCRFAASFCHANAPHDRGRGGDGDVSLWSHSRVLPKIIVCCVLDTVLSNLQILLLGSRVHQNYVNICSWSEVPLKIESALCEHFLCFIHKSISEKQSQK